MTRLEGFSRHDSITTESQPVSKLVYPLSQGVLYVSCVRVNVFKFPHFVLVTSSCVLIIQVQRAKRQILRRQSWKLNFGGVSYSKPGARAVCCIRSCQVTRTHCWLLALELMVILCSESRNLTVIYLCLSMDDSKVPTQVRIFPSYSKAWRNYNVIITQF